MDDLEKMTVWLCIGLLAGISIFHSRVLQRLQAETDELAGFREITSRLGEPEPQEREGA